MVLQDRPAHDQPPSVLVRRRPVQGQPVHGQDDRAALRLRRRRSRPICVDSQLDQLLSVDHGLTVLFGEGEPPTDLVTDRKRRSAALDLPALDEHRQPHSPIITAAEQSLGA